MAWFLVQGHPLRQLCVCLVYLLMHVSKELVFPLLTTFLASLPFFWGALHVFLFISLSLRRNMSSSLPPVLTLKHLLYICCCEPPSSRPVFTILATSNGLSGGWFCLCSFSFQWSFFSSVSPILCIHQLVAMAGALWESDVSFCLSLSNAGVGKLLFYLLSFMFFMKEDLWISRQLVNPSVGQSFIMRK